MVNFQRELPPVMGRTTPCNGCQKPMRIVPNSAAKPTCPSCRKRVCLECLTAFSSHDRSRSVFCSSECSAKWKTRKTVVIDRG